VIKMFGKNKKDKLKEKIEKQKQELKKMEGAKMQFEIKDGSIKKQEEVKTEPEAGSLFDGAIHTTSPIQGPVSKGPEQTSQEQEMMIEQQRQHMVAIEQQRQQAIAGQQKQQREQIMANQQEQLRQEQERMMQGPPVNKSQPIGPVPLPVNTVQDGTLGLTIFLTEKETLEKMQIPVIELATLTDALDKAIVEQTAFKIGGSVINGLYIKRYLIE